jgi:lipopolysaccharide transport system ATP-binding protein
MEDLGVVQVSRPSTGRVTINGRVASLLEVGTGFHPELSGRGNVYLNVTEQMKISLT